MNFRRLLQGRLSLFRGKGQCGSHDGYPDDYEHRRDRAEAGGTFGVSIRCSHGGLLSVVGGPAAWADRGIEKAGFAPPILYSALFYSAH